MDPRTESIKQEVDQTLENMAEKMEQIESRARETVQNVKEKLDIRHLTAEHPWTMLGASVAVGFLAGNIRRPGSRRRRRLAATAAEFEGGRRFSYEHGDDPYENIEDEDYGQTEMVHVSGYEPGAGEYGQEASGYGRGAGWGVSASGGGAREQSGHGRGMREQGGYGREQHHPSREIVRRSISRVSSRVKERAPGILASLKEQFGDEIEALKKAALITVGNSLSGLIHKNLPQFAQEFDRIRQDGGHDGEQGWQSQQRTQGWSQGQGESRYGGESRQGSEGRRGGEGRYGSESRYGSGSQYGSEGRYGSGNQYGGEYQGQSERYGQGEGRYGNQGQGRYGSQGQGETRYGSQQGQQGQGRYGSQGQGEGRYGSQQARGYNPDSPNIGSSVEGEHGNRDNEGGYGSSGHPSGRKGHN